VLPNNLTLKFLLLLITFCIIITFKAYEILELETQIAQQIDNFSTHLEGYSIHRLKN